MVRGNTENITIEEEMERSYLDYAMSVIVARALPDARDGLKPVHRRILYAMQEGGYTASNAYRKSARIVGEVMGKYHPHGDVPVYDAMVRMAQHFSMRLALIDSQGNFGSIDGDRAAAMRYTEARLERAGEALLQDIDKNTVDFLPNYDGTLVEPRVLPARLPNLLVNGGGGIAVGMATNIPPHNLAEVCALCRALLKKPDLTLEELIERLPGPDFPTGALILGRDAVKECYRKGRGAIVVRARSAIEPLKGGRNLLLFTEIPYQTNKARIIERIAELVREKKVVGISDLRDESDREGLRIAVEVKASAHAEQVRALLFKHTALQTSYSVQLLALDRGQPRLMNLKKLLTVFLDFRDEVLRRRTAFLLRKAQRRLHSLCGLLVATDEIERVVAIVRAAVDAEQARQALMAETWSARALTALLERSETNGLDVGTTTDTALTSEAVARMASLDLRAGGKCRLSRAQCQAILELRLQRLVGLEKEKLLAEARENLARIVECRLLLASKERRAQRIEEDLREVERLFATERRTDIVEQEVALEEDAESFVQHEEVVVTITRQGYVKRVASKTYRSQNRGGKGRAGMKIGEADDLMQTCFVSTKTQLLFFTSRGRVYALSASDLPEGKPQGGGRNVANLLELTEGERVTNITPLPHRTQELKNKSLVFATASGNVRRNALENFTRIMRNGIIAMKIPDGDALVGAVVCDEGDDLFLASRDAQAVRFPLSALRVFSSRESSGVRGINLAKDDTLVSIASISTNSGEKTAIFTALASGYGKRTLVEEYRCTARGGKGVKNTLLSKDDEVVASLPVQADDQLNLYSNQGQFSRINAENVSLFGRATRGVRLFDLKKDERLVAVGKILPDSSEAHDNGDNGGNGGDEASETSGASEASET